MGKYEIRATAENCTGCLRCQLGCSEFYTKVFNPSQACILVDTSGINYAISFTEECRECGVCADQCFYGALEKTGRVTNDK